MTSALFAQFRAAVVAQHSTSLRVISAPKALALEDRAALRRRLGYGPAERVCVVTAGATAVGRGLIERCLDAARELEGRLPGLRVVVAAGPRIDLATLTAPASVELHGHLADLHEHMAAADVAVVGGSGTTALELMAAGRPFLWFPLRRHSVQREHVAHRILRRGGPLPMEYAETSAAALASAIVTRLGTEVHYRALPDRSSVDRAADQLAALL